MKLVKYTDNDSSWGFTVDKLYDADHLVDDRKEHRWLVQESIRLGGVWSLSFKNMDFKTYLNQIELE